MIGVRSLWRPDTPAADAAGDRAEIAATGAASRSRDAVEHDAWTVLAAVDRLGPVGFAALLDRFGSGREILQAAVEPGGVERLAEVPYPGRADDRRRPIHPSVARAIAEAAATAPRTLARLRDLGLSVITLAEPDFPSRLAGIEWPPHVLFVRGDRRALGREHAVAVVGTRRATSAGRTTAARIATALAGAGASVVSGLAFGIDGAAHEAAVRAGGTTVAVIGGGHARLTPRAHDRLARAIETAGGAVVSEYAPDIEPTKGTFPRRNRIISGLAQATVVVEAPPSSGALITASWALEQGRECFVVPGPIDAPASAGCLSFLREHASEVRVVAGIPQLVADLGLAGPRGERGVGPDVAATIQELGRTEAAVAGLLVAGLVTVDEIVATADLPVATVLAALTMLERRGLAVGVHGRFRPAGTLLGPAPPPRLR